MIIIIVVVRSSVPPHIQHPLRPIYSIPKPKKKKKRKEKERKETL
jgi:hypothetical protein